MSNIIALLYVLFFVFCMFNCNFSNPHITPCISKLNSNYFSLSRAPQHNRQLKVSILTKMNHLHMFQLFIVLIGLILLLYDSLLQLCHYVPYLPFNTNLTLCKYRINYNPILSELIPSIMLLLLLGIECPVLFYPFIRIILLKCCRLSLTFTLKNRKKVQSLIFIVISFYIFESACEPITQTLSLFIFQIFCHRFVDFSAWLPGLLIVLSNDIHVNPGPKFSNAFLTFMSWNVNSLAKNDFQRIKLIEAHNSLSTMP